MGAVGTAAVHGVFVYGTLMPGERLWPALYRFAAGWEPATARGHLWDTGRGYPAARFDNRAAEVAGVLVRISPDRLTDALAVLDHVEEEGSLYRRVEVVTSGGPAVAYEWLGTTEDLTPLAGSWKKVRC